MSVSLCIGLLQFLLCSPLSICWRILVCIEGNRHPSPCNITILRQIQDQVCLQQLLYTKCSALPCVFSGQRKAGYSALIANHCQNPTKMNHGYFKIPEKWGVLPPHFYQNPIFFQQPWPVSLLLASSTVPPSLHISSSEHHHAAAICFTVVHETVNFKHPVVLNLVMWYVTENEEFFAMKFKVHIQQIQPGTDPFCQSCPLRVRFIPHTVAPAQHPQTANFVTHLGG